MGKHILFILALFSGYMAVSQTTVNGSFLYDGLNRTYSFYVPATYSPGTPVPLIIGLHGTGSSGSEFAQYRNFRPIADTANFIMAHPDGSTMLGQKFWNYGNVLGSTVDDVGFLEALIDTISAHYSVNPARVYCVGMSNGGFMTYYMACQTNRFAAIGSVTGSMGTTMYNNCHPVRPTPSIHIHGTSDPINPYAGNSTSKGIQDVTMFWVNENSCHVNPVMYPVPDVNTTDGATAERYLYSNGVDGHTVEHFKVIGGEHTWPGSPMPGSTDVICMDFDARKEIWRFFRQYKIAGTTSVHDISHMVYIATWPNPVRDILYIRGGSNPATHIAILDMQGRVVEEHVGEDICSIYVGNLSPGIYTAKISGSGFSVMRKLVLATGN